MLTKYNRKNIRKLYEINSFFIINRHIMTVLTQEGKHFWVSVCITCLT